MLTTFASRNRGLRHGGHPLWLILVTSCSGPSAAEDSRAVEPVVATAMVVLPDTQFYACAYPTIFESQAQWIIDHRQDEHLGLVVHTGDIVDKDIPSQWAVAAESLHRLDGTTPYLLATGNHDLEKDRGSEVGKYFKPGDLSAPRFKPVLRSPDRIDNSYGIEELDGDRWLILGLEFGPRDSVLDWASNVLDEHSELPAIVFTHAYLYSDGHRYDRNIQPLQPYHPDLFNITPSEGINDGEDLWQKLIVPHENVALVLSGHVIPNGIAHSTAVRPSGTRVHQVLANYQHCDLCPCSEVEGGGGYLRILRFDHENRTIQVSTYSPHLNRSLTDDQNEFRLDLDSQKSPESGAGQ